eukprot:CAMPEP_0117430022 /NCGR_PEP_ID=MMETSP0758-20121206/9543_1 /TAXON_ID=63605 /ORGANISM="Percolomonas cosmopolitus, Strain AE-1 (ATCC 50343)" /LENGTH=1038 /DNA_ID=CAMNT_0005217589 /DNA_START=136 /DNA_END=3248 /DNA_ORIENTATION=-
MKRNIIVKEKMKENDAHLEIFMDRTMRTLGKNTMGKLRESRILVVGASGLGIEICKNLILTGVRTVGLYDDQQCQWHDLSTNFAINEEAVKQQKSRIEASKDTLNDLTPSFVQLLLFDAYHSKMTIEEAWSSMDVVIFTEHVFSSQLISYNNQLRKEHIKFISCEARGLCGRIFVDFLDSFVIMDQNAEKPSQNVIIGIEKGNETTIFVNDKRRNHGLEEGDFVTFEGVSGMTMLNKQEYSVTRVINTHSFMIKLNSNNFPNFGGHGMVVQVKKPHKVHFKPLEEAMKNPEYMIYDYSKLNHSKLLHHAFTTLGQYIKKYQRLPRPHHDEDTNSFLALCDHHMSDDDDDDDKNQLYTLFAKTCAGSINPMTTFLGGLVAQEALKGVSGKYTPLHQFFYFDALECVSQLNVEDASPQSCRYDGQIAVFGKKFQERLQQLSVFLVGVGALGCEYLKNLALMGVSTKGKLTCTDLDSIELSNLSRQFLFRERHIGRMKSTCAAEMVLAMNPSLNLEALQDKVSSETEHLFHSAFWESLDVVINALDNEEARRYTDLQCVHYWLPLIEAGTLGAKGNVQVVVPNLTENYGASQDPPEEETHMCTIKNFPYEIQHTIVWAKSLFDQLFHGDIQHLNDFLSQPVSFLNRMREKDLGTQVSVYESLLSNLTSSRCTSFSDCVLWARDRFQHLFYNLIHELLTNFPLDATTTQGGAFWIGDKRPPVVLHFDLNNTLHYDFLRFASKLRASNFRIPFPSRDSLSTYQSILVSYQPSPFVPSKQSMDGDDLKMADDDHESRVSSLLSSLSSFIDSSSNHSINHPFTFPLLCFDFEKDHDDNFHVDFVTSASNCRAFNYSIPPASRLFTKGIAGQIVPAMITTTSSVTGLGMFELFKVVQQLPSLSSFKNSFLNLSLPLVLSSEPAPPSVSSMFSPPKMVSIWERIPICAGRDIYLRDFIKYFDLKFHLVLEMIIWKSFVIYNVHSSPSKFLKQPLSSLVSSQSNCSIPSSTSFLYLDIACCDPQTNEDVDMPTVRYQFRNFDESQLSR